MEPTDGSEGGTTRPATTGMEAKATLRLWVSQSTIPVAPIRFSPRPSMRPWGAIECQGCPDSTIAVPEGMGSLTRQMPTSVPGA